MNTLAERVKYARELKKISQCDIAKKAGISQPTYFKIENGLTLKPRNIVEIAQALNVNPDWLATGEGSMENKPTIDELRNEIAKIEQNSKKDLQKSQVLSMSKPVPVINWIAAGSWTETNPTTLDDVIDYLPRPIGLSDDGFCLIVRGESMMPEFKPDEIIYVEPNFDTQNLQNGDLVVVQESHNNEATFKQLVIGETSNDIYLRPLNKNWHEQRMIPKSEWRLIGKVVGKWVKY